MKLKKREIIVTKSFTMLVIRAEVHTHSHMYIYTHMHVCMYVCIYCCPKTPAVLLSLARSKPTGEKQVFSYSKKNIYIYNH